MLSLFLSLLFAVSATSPVAARREAISRTKESIVAECRAAAGGDWQAWHDRMLPFRVALQTRLQPTWDHPAVSRTMPSSTGSFLSWVDEPGEYIHSNAAFGIAGGANGSIPARKQTVIS